MLVYDLKAKIAFLQKLVNSYATLKITKTQWLWSFKRKYYPVKVGSNINELKEMLYRHIRPYNWVEMDKFIKGDIKSLTLDNGSYKWQISV